MSAQHSGDEGDLDLKEQDRYLPIANVARIMKKSLPENAKIAKEAKECVQECVSEFISFITSEASDRCQQEKRKTINGEDILWAMQSLGFENYAEALKIYLVKYRETTKLDRGASGAKEKDEEGVLNDVQQQQQQQQQQQLYMQPNQDGQQPMTGNYYNAIAHQYLDQQKQS
ncbi:histone-fold-containing protein [Syncephalastrum racemosum]|uniref:Histone-fold-containing protein n=1 Tax=Syncephalastrum racemosum TaxID=13706 RepID=A0A1X2HI48_SYNRA|nr:histone-fold-containing protein [Syncephalastrum racemosum]